ncbi:MAG TPA: peptidoglycan DD-metalloendopeptidase family protein [Candidatus Acidoferrum sp.]|nr:peptidoglycan DD-metalloendopeptidase family protein [Candidatus Acidoferrum sp.]
MQIRKWITMIGLLVLTACGSNYQAPIGQSGDMLYLNSGRQHLVNEGETIYAIAWMYDLDPNKLAQANNLSADDTVAPGQKLLVDLRNFSSRPAVAAPGAAKSRAVENSAVATARPAQGLGGLQRSALPESDAASQPTRTALPPSEPAAAAAGAGTAASQTAAPVAGNLGSGAKTAGATVAGVAAGAGATKASSSAFTGTGDISWAWPYRGNIVGKFAEGGAESKGIDIAGKEGDPILAAADGEVVYAGSGLLRYGNLLIIKHNDKYLSAYAHNKALLVSEKAKVTKGQKIAELGSSGIDKPQLHFEIRVDGKPVDPLTFLPPQK